LLLGTKEEGGKKRPPPRRRYEGKLDISARTEQQKVEHRSARNRNALKEKRIKTTPKLRREDSAKPKVGYVGGGPERQETCPPGSVQWQKKKRKEGGNKKK